MSSVQNFSVFLLKIIIFILTNVHIINCYSFPLYYVVTVADRRNQTRTDFVCENLFFTLSADISFSELL